MDAVFSSQNDPLKRFAQYADSVVGTQLEAYAKSGNILGCPFCSVGCELSTQDEAIRRKTQEISERVIRYFAASVRDAVAQGLLPATTVAEDLARQLYYFVTGILTLSKIENNPETLKGLKPGIFRLLGCQPSPAAEAVAAA